MMTITEGLQQVMSEHRDIAHGTLITGIYTLKQVTVSRFIIAKRRTCTSYLGDIGGRYFNIRPSFVDPVFYPLQNLARDVFIRTDRNESEHRHRGVILPVNLGASNVEAVSRPPQNTFDDTPLLFERVGREGKVDFEAEHKQFKTHSAEASGERESRHGYFPSRRDT